MGPANDESAVYSMLENNGKTEVIQEPLLGLSAGILRPETSPIYHNLIVGTAVLAQGGVCGLALVIWGAIFIAGLHLISWHILLNSTGVLLTTQGMLLLQPTHTLAQKRQGTSWHSAFNVGSLSAFLSGLVIIELNKFAHNGAHFKSLHAYLGLFSYLLLLLQGLVGFTQYYTPMVYGSVDRAKSMWKYHRAGGYFTIIMTSLTIAAAVDTDYNQMTLHLPMWIVLIALLLILIGIFTRVRLFKLGIGRR